MPAKSAKQYKFMQMIAHGGKSNKSAVGPSEEVAKEFVSKTSKDKRSMFAKKGKKKAFKQMGKLFKK